MKRPKDHTAELKLKIKNFTQKANSAKIIIWTLLFSFGFMIFITNFGLLDAPSNLEALRLEAVQNAKEYLKNFDSPLTSSLQVLADKAAPRKLILFRLPSAILTLASIALLAFSIPNLTKNKFLPYLFTLFAITSPFFILPAHQGASTAVELFFALSLITFATCRIYNQEKVTGEGKDWLLLTSGLALLIHQPLGLILAPLIVILLSAKLKFYQNLKELKLSQKLIAISPILVSIGVLATVIALEPNHIKSLFLVDNLELATLKLNLKNSIKITLGLKQYGPLNLLLIVSLVFLIKGFKNRRTLSLTILLGLISSVFVAALFPNNSAIILTAPFVVAPVSLVVSELITRTDRLFPRNPYPRFLARTLSFTLAISIAMLGLYTFNHATLRQHSTLPSLDTNQTQN